MEKRQGVQDMASLEKRSRSITSILLGCVGGLVTGLLLAPYMDGLGDLIPTLSLMLVACGVVSLIILFYFDSSKKKLRNEMLRMLPKHGIKNVNRNECKVLFSIKEDTYSYDQSTVIFLDPELSESFKIGFANKNGGPSTQKVSLEGAEFISFPGVVFKEFKL